MKEKAIISNVSCSLQTCATEGHTGHTEWLTSINYKSAQHYIAQLISYSRSSLILYHLIYKYLLSPFSTNIKYKNVIPPRDETLSSACNPWLFMAVLLLKQPKYNAGEYSREIDRMQKVNCRTVTRAEIDVNYDFPKVITKIGICHFKSIFKY